MNKLLRLGSYMLTVFLAACNADSDETFVDADDLAAQQDIIIQDYINDNSLSAKKDTSGVYYIVENSNGAGTSAAGKVVYIYYTASVLGGSVFDDHTSEDGDPVIMEQGANAILPIGLDNGLALMKEGETFTFILPSGKAYSIFQFSNLIPANSIILMQVTVVSVQSLVERLTDETSLIDDYIYTNELNDTVAHPATTVEALSSGIWFKTLTRGYGNRTPSDGDLVTVSYEGRFLDEKPFDASGSTPFRFNFNTQTVIPGFDAAVANMVEGQRALAIMPSNQAYSSGVREIPEFFKPEFVAVGVIPQYTLVVDPYDILIFEITLQSIN